MIIVHDCTDNGKYKLLTVDLGSYYIKDGQYDETRNIDLNNAGEWTNEVIGTKAMVMSKIFIFNV
ncbi:Apyrase [Caenorhabditis elegans]|nr:Apyrase [Caenorhabditis elegans]CDK13365.1 Apyrase [Caenorhabditis elegans]|eukprot:NP_001293177.1 Uncharacterized protein CELE_Y18H1A.8 [Caenorhabditis elegans]